MEKKEKIMSVEDSFDSSNCSVIESNIRKWADAELERLASRGKGGSKFHLQADLDANVGSVCCADYTMKFNWFYGVIDLVINSEEDSPIWNDVKNNVPAQFASILSAPEYFIYRLSSNTSDKKEFYGFDPTEGESGEILPIEEFSAISAWRAANFDSLFCPDSKNLFFTECLNAF